MKARPDQVIPENLDERQRMLRRVPEILAGLLGVGLPDLELRRDDPSGADLVITAGPTFLIEVSSSASSGPIAARIARAKAIADRAPEGHLPLVVVPFMGEVGRQLCEQSGVGWIDLSGNAQIIGPGLRVVIQGKPSRFKSVRRPGLFSPKSSRMIRWLLIHAAGYHRQRDIARATAIDEGFVSRLANRLVETEYLTRDSWGRLRVKDPAVLLDSWREAYEFSKHTIHRGHVAARSGDALLRAATDVLVERQIEYAATGLAAAWVLTHFAAFRVVTIYLTDDPPGALLDQLGYSEDPRGANLWLVIPNDAGVLQGAQETEGIRCVHPVQVYLDLKAHPERSPEAAERLRAEFLTWKSDG